jgi:hypothetical protein
VIEVYRDNLDGTATLIDQVDEFGRDEGELTGLDFPETGFYFVRVCQAVDEAFVPGGYALIIYVPAGFQGVNVYAWDVINNLPISGATVSLSGFASSNTDASGVARYPFAGRGNYSASVVAPGGGQYLPLFGVRSASETASNALSAYGNARSLRADAFATVAYSGVALAESAYLVFGFVPVSYVTGTVRQETFGLPVEDAFIGFFRNSDNALFRGYPWTSYGTPWQTGGNGVFPGETILLPNTPYRMEIRAPGYPEIVQNITTPHRGGTLDLGELVAQIHYGGNSIPDAWELFYNLATNIDENADGDFDGMGAYAEFVAGTIPTDGASNLAFFEQAAATNESVTVRWLAQPNRRYRVLQSESLIAPVWTSVYEPLPVDQSEVMEYLHAAGDGVRYFQVDVRFP